MDRAACTVNQNKISQNFNKCNPVEFYVVNITISIMFKVILNKICLIIMNKDINIFLVKFSAITKYEKGRKFVFCRFFRVILKDTL